MPVVQLAVVSSLPSQQLAAVLRTQVVPELQAIDGVQAVTLSGVEQMQLQIKLEPRKTLALGVHADADHEHDPQANVTGGAAASRPAASSIRSR